MKIHVGNLSYNVTEAEILAEFEVYGKVESVFIPSDKLSGQSKGYAFVEMLSKDEAEAAIGLSGKTLKGRAIVVGESCPRAGTIGSGWSGSHGGSGYGGSRGNRSGGGKKRKR